VSAPNADLDKMSAMPTREGTRIETPVLELARNVATNVARGLHALGKPRRSAILPRPTGTVLWSIALLFAAAAAMFLLDAAAVDWARIEPHWFRGAFERITDLGLSGWFLFPCGFILLFLAAVTSPKLTALARGMLAALAARFGFVFLAVALPGLFVSIAKHLIGRARPYVGGHEDPFAYMPFIWRPAFASMPSGHATTAVAAAIAIGAIWPRTRTVMWFYAAAIIVSRVAVLAHHPSDVIAGALIALVGTHILRRWFATRGLVFRASDLRAKSGPSLNRIKAALRQAVSAPSRSA
jgi:membrane-associated phospholipid phosphatase